MLFAIKIRSFSKTKLTPIFWPWVVFLVKKGWQIFHVVVGFDRLFIGISKVFIGRRTIDTYIFNFDTSLYSCKLHKVNYDLFSYTRVFRNNITYYYWKTIFTKIWELRDLFYYTTFILTQLCPIYTP